MHLKINNFIILIFLLSKDLNKQSISIYVKKTKWINIQLSVLEILQGIFTLVFVIIGVYVGIRIALKYLKNKDWHYIFAGFTWIGMASAYFSASINFIMIILFNTYLSIELYLLISNTFLPIIILVWLIFFTDLFYKDKRKPVLIIQLVFTTAYEFLFFLYIFIDPSQIATYAGPFAIAYSLVFIIFNAIFIVIVLITALLFAKLSLESDDGLIRLRGKFLTIAIILLIIGIFMDLLFPTSWVVLISRLILIVSSFNFYFGLIMPKWIKRRFLKDDKI